MPGVPGWTNDWTSTARRPPELNSWEPGTGRPFFPSRITTCRVTSSAKTTHEHHFVFLSFRPRQARGLDVWSKGDVTEVIKILRRPQ